RTNYGDHTKVGVIAPYRVQVNRLQFQFKNDGLEIEADTIHKFQGREKDVIIFNTVKDEVTSFMDNPNLINVAVSRAVKEFIVVKSASMKAPHGTNIGDLIRYIDYTTNPEDTLIHGKINSVFDLLYKEYKIMLITFLSSRKNKMGSPAEIIIDQLLTEKILTDEPEFASINVIREYPLRDLVHDLDSLTEDQIRFVNNNSRVDF